MRSKYLLVGVVGTVVGVLLSSVVVVLAGDDLDAPAGPTDPASQMYTLEQIYDRLATGAVSAKMETFTEPSSGPAAGTGRTLDDVMDLAMAVGNPDPPCFDNANRYVDCGNGTVHDTVTNLTWLKNANCYGQLNYAAANNAAAGLEDGECSLTDGSSPGDWRLPTKAEWEATIGRAVALSCTNPSLTDTAGTACYSAGPPFTGVQSDLYWSSTAYEGSPVSARYVSLLDGVVSGGSKTNTCYVWPVRGGQ